MNELTIFEEVSVSTTEFVNTITKTLFAYIKNNAINKHPAVFIQGQPGIGKSQSVYQIKKNIEK